MKKKFCLKALALIGLVLTVLLVSIFFIVKPMRVKEFQDKNDSLKQNSQQILNTTKFVIKGSVSSIESPEWNTGDKKKPILKSKNDIVYQNIIINVDKVLRGSIDSNKILIKVYKSNTLAKQNGIEKFEDNENVILFLKYDDSIYNKDKDYSYYVLNGGPLGKYTIKDDNAINLVDQMSVDDLYKLITNNK